MVSANPAKVDTRLVFLQLYFTAACSAVDYETSVYLESSHSKTDSVVDAYSLFVDSLSPPVWRSFAVRPCSF